MSSTISLADLGLTDTVLKGARAPGRVKQVISMVPGRDLEPGDLIAAASENPDPIQPLELKALRRSHHELAKLVAQNLPNVTISEITGYSPARISVLKDDPQFQELVKHYSEIENEAYTQSRADFHERLAALGFDSMEALHQRLLDEPETFTPKEMLQILEATADRIGHGKTSTHNLNVASVTLDAKDLADIRGGQVASQATGPTTLNHESLLRLAVRATEPHPADEALSGSEGEGAGVREEGDQGVNEEVRGEADLPSVD